MLQVRQVLLTAKDRAMPHQPITGIYKSIHTHYNTRSNPWETETNRSSIDVCQNSSDESKTVDQRPSIDSLRGGGGGLESQHFCTKMTFFKLIPACSRQAN